MSIFSKNIRLINRGLSFTKFRVSLSKKAILFILLFSPNFASAQKDLINPPVDIQTIPAGSFVIPMDTTYQSIVPAGDIPFNLKAYGLINEFLQNGIPVKWAINALKQKDSTDFIATAERYAPGYVAPNTIRFRAGPFIVPDTTLPCGFSTTQIINSYGNNVAVYKLTIGAIADIRYTLTHKPKIAVFNNGGNQVIHTKILDAAGIGEYDVMDAADIDSLINCYTFVSEPHADESEVSMDVVNGVKAFVENGGNFLAECHAIDTYENRAFFHTTAGIDVINTNASHSYPNANLSYSQIDGPLNENDGGSIVNWTPKVGSTFKSQTYKSVTHIGGDTVIAMAAHITAPSASGGNVYYLGGHDYSKGGKDKTVANPGSLARLNAMRMYLNATMVPSGNNNNVWANAGPAEVSMACTDSVILGCDPTGPSNATFLWTPAAGLSCTTCPNPIAKPTVTTTYNVVVSNGCIASDTIRVAVTSREVANFSTGNACLGNTTKFTDKSIASSFWKWDFGDPVSGVDNTSNLQDPSHIYNTVGTYTVNLISGSSPTCSDTVEQIVVIQVAPTMTANSSTICNGESTTLTANSSMGTYLWSTGETTQAVTLMPSISTSYTVTSDTSQYCVSTAISDITVNQPPTVSVNSIATSNWGTICESDSTTLVASGANSYLWSNGETTQSITVTPSSSTTYTVTGDSAGCNSSAIGTVTINALPVISINSATICEGETGSLSASGAAAYLWSTGATTQSITGSPTTTTSYTVTGTTLACASTTTGIITVNTIPVITSTDTAICEQALANLTASGADSFSWSSGETTPSITVSPSSTTSYTVTGTSNGCFSSATSIVTVNPIPIISTNSATICEGESETLTANGADNYTWSTGSTSQAITSTPSATTSYTVTGSSLGCTSEAIGTINVNPIPVITVNAETICDGESIIISASGADTYLWNNGETTLAITTNPSTTSSYTVTGNSLGCNSSAVSTVTVNPMPIVTINPTTICEGESGTITANGADTYSWSTGETTPSIIDSPTTSTTYTVIGNSLGCTSATTGTITVNLIPVVTVNSATICEGESETLTANGADNYTWSTGSTSQAITDTPSATTSYTVTGNTLGCVSEAIGTTTVNPIPVITVNAETICNGGSALLTANGSSNYTWSTGESSTTISDNPTTTTNYTVTGNDLGCTSSVITSITVNPIPIIISNSTTICNGETGTISANGADAYSWSTGDNSQSITDAPATTTTYTVIGNSLGCTSATIGTITVNPLPVTITNSATICEGESETLTANGANNYTWSTGATSQTITTTPSTTTSYTVTGNSLGCTSEAVGTITVNPIPVITVNTETICNGESATLTANGASDYTWSTGENSQTITDNPNSTTTYTVTGNSLSCYNTIIGNIIVNPIPTVSLNSSTICEGETTTLTASGADGYTWSFGSGSDDAISVSPTQTTSYSVTGNSLGCQGSATGTINVNPLPIVTVNAATICTGELAILTANGADSYSWSNGATASFINESPTQTTSYTVLGSSLGCTNSVVGLITVNPIPNITVNSETICEGESATLFATGTANSFSWSSGEGSNGIMKTPNQTSTYSVTASSLGCSITVSGVITVNPVPVVNINSNTICAGENTSITANGANTYVWSTGETSSTITPTLETTTSYTVTGNSLGCTHSDIATITVNPSPNVTLNSATICEGETATLTAIGEGTFRWSTNATSSNSITDSPLSTKTFTVTATSLSCFRSATGTIYVNPIPAVSVDTKSICLGESATLTASGADIYSWSTGANTVSISESPTRASNSYTVTGSSLGCVNSAVGKIYVKPNPIVSVNSTSICLGETTTLTANGADSYTWQPGNLTRDSITISPSNTIIYSVTGNQQGCTHSASGTIIVHALPKADFDYTPDEIKTIHPVVTFIDQSSTDAISWYWNFGDGESLETTTNNNPTHTYPKEEDQFDITLIVNNGKCYDAITKTIVIEEAPVYSFFIPNAFTPNDDRVNDGFRGKGVGIIEYQLTIFDRWDNLIWQSNDLFEEWDGKANGEADIDTLFAERGYGTSQQDVYVWTVKLTDVFGIKHDFIGTVTIVR